MRYPKRSLNRENYPDQATVCFVAGSRLVAQSQMAQFECFNDCELNRQVRFVVDLSKPAANRAMSRCFELKDEVNCERAPTIPGARAYDSNRSQSVARGGCAVSCHAGNVQRAARKTDAEGDQEGDNDCCGDAARARR